MDNVEALSLAGQAQNNWAQLEGLDEIAAAFDALQSEHIQDERDYLPASIIINGRIEDYDPDEILRIFRHLDLDAYCRAYERLGLPMIEVHGVEDGVCTCSAGAACSNPGKHPVPTGWTEKATTSADEMIRRIGDQPRNIGLTMGHGFMVLDVDGPEGRASITALEAQHGRLPAGPRQVTGSGGLHFLFRTSRVFTNRVKFRPGLDIRSTNGQIVAAPSTHASGRAYAWSGLLGLTSPDQIPELPEWLAAVISDAGARDNGPKRPVEDLGYDNAAPWRALTSAEIASISRELEGLAPAINRQGGNPHTGRVIAACLAKIFKLLDWDRCPPRWNVVESIHEDAMRCLDAWNRKCEPPWEADGPDSLARYVRSTIGWLLEKRFENAEWIAGVTGEPARPTRALEQILLAVLGSRGTLNGPRGLFKDDGFMLDVDSLGDIDMGSVRDAFKTVDIGVRDFNGALREWRASWQQRTVAQAPELTDGDGRSQVLVQPGEIHAAVASAILNLGASRDPDVFAFGTSLATVETADSGEDDDQKIRRGPGAPTISEVSKGRLAALLCETSRFVRSRESRTTGETIFVPSDPPPAVVSAVHEDGRFRGVRPLVGIASTPVLRPDGTVFATPGYDDQTGWLYRPSANLAGLDVPERPGWADAQAAVTALLEVICDFRFASDAPGRDRDAPLGPGEIDRAVWLAALLSLVGKSLYIALSGAPMFALDAPVQGTGKTLLAQTLAKIALGTDFAAVKHSASSPEMSKHVFALLRKGDPAIMLDNVERGTRVGCSALHAVLTSRQYSDRVLQVTETRTYPCNSVWFVTGNNLRFDQEMARRVLRCRQNAREVQPHTRGDFKHPHLLTWIEENRARLLTAALTILRAYHAAGRPESELRPLGSFEAWTGAIRQPMAWLGLPDPLGGCVASDEDGDPGQEALNTLLTGWRALDPHSKGLTAASVLRWLSTGTLPADGVVVSKYRASQVLCQPTDPGADSSGAAPRDVPEAGRWAQAQRATRS